MSLSFILLAAIALAGGAAPSDVVVPPRVDGVRLVAHDGRYSIEAPEGWRWQRLSDDGSRIERYIAVDPASARAFTFSYDPHGRFRATRVAVRDYGARLARRMGAAGMQAGEIEPLGVSSPRARSWRLQAPVVMPDGSIRRWRAIFVPAGGAFLMEELAAEPAGEFDAFVASFRLMRPPEVIPANLTQWNGIFAWLLLIPIAALLNRHRRARAIDGGTAAAVVVMIIAVAVSWMISTAIDHDALSQLQGEAWGNAMAPFVITTAIALVFARSSAARRGALASYAPPLRSALRLSTGALAVFAGFAAPAAMMAESDLLRLVVAVVQIALFFAGLRLILTPAPVAVVSGDRPLSSTA